MTTLFWLIIIVALVGVAGNEVVIWLLGLRIHRNAISVSILNLPAADIIVLFNYIVVLLMQKKHQTPKLVLQRALEDAPEEDGHGGSLDQENLETSGSRGEQGRRACAWASDVALQTTSVSFLGKNTATATLSSDVNRTNGNSYDFFETCPVAMILSWLILIMAGVGATGNAVVVWLLGFRMCRNAISVYVLNLAVADFIILNSYFILLVLEMSLRFFNVIILHVSVYIILCSYITGLSMLSGISMERCLSVLCPIWYRCHRPRYMSAVICGILWILSLLITTFNVYICFIHSANPIIYFLIGSFRQRRHNTLKLVLQRALQDTAEDGYGDSLPRETLEVSGSTMEQG
ncbi:mas-related G-protein coupled receptor member X1-like [Nannospalax galili]|uniref:mas-related G-protein coupled receptor member X1-like n=1 Tax=Nannospalax galili TaxID=1026970 RepID=UPI000819F294|nr:mas-related G-protein coupled receptor member X1-like [Nannospalax galili]